MYLVIDLKKNNQLHIYDHMKQFLLSMKVNRQSFDNQTPITILR